MNRQNLENILVKLVSEKFFNDYGAIKDDELVQFIEPLIDNDEDLDEALELISNSSCFNHITLENGEGWLFTHNKEDIKDLIVLLPDRGDFWHDYITVEGEKYSMALADFYEFYVKEDNKK